MPKFHRPLPPITYLDMDGVCAAWTEEVFALYGREMPAPPAPMPYEVQHTLGVDEDEMWDRINGLGIEWWASLPPYPWFRDLFSRLQGLGPRVVVLTSPCTIGNSAAGKVRWLRKHIGEDFRDYVITSRKHLLSRPCTVLVDDSDEKLDRFAEFGGSAVVFPRQWNSGGFIHGDAIVEHVVSRVRDAFLRDGVEL